MSSRFGKMYFCDTWSVEAGVVCEDSDETLWVALDPRSRGYLLKQGVAPERIDTEVGRISKKQRGDLALLSGRMTQWFRARVHFPELGDLNEGEAGLAVWYIYYALNHYLWLLEFNRVFAKHYKPRQLGAFIPAHISYAKRHVAAQDGCLGQLTAAFAENAGCGFTGLAASSQAVEPIWGGLKERLRPFWRRYRRVQLEQIIRAAAAATARPLIATNHHYRMGTVIEHLVARGIDAPTFLLDGCGGREFAGNFSLSHLAESLPIDEAGHTHLLEKLEEVARAVELEEGEFEYAGVSIAKMVAAKIRGGIAPFIADMHRSAQAIEFILKETKPRMVLSAGDRDEDRLIGAVCRRMGIPGVMISHGSHVVPKSGPEKVEWGEHTIGKMQSPFSHLALQSPQAEAHCDIFPTESTPVRTGPLLWGSAIAPERSEPLRRELLGAWQGKVVVHAGSPKGGENSRFYIYETGNEYVQAIAELAAAVEAMSDVLLIVKFRPSELVGTEDLKALVPFSDKVLLSVDEPFLDVLGFTDLMVSFSSTTVEEALLNNVPVLFYGGEGRYQHIEAPFYQSGEDLPLSPLYAIGSAGDLVDGLGRVLGKIGDLSSRDFDYLRYAPEQITPVEELVRQCAASDLASVGAR